MRNGLKHLVQSGLRAAGYELRAVKQKSFWDTTYHDQPDWILQIVDEVQSFTLTGYARIVALCNAIEYISRCGIPGDIVECGVWKGGSMMAAALALLHCQDSSRRLFLFDTFEGMTAPTDVDIDFQGRPAADLLAEGAREGLIWARSPIEEVQENLAKTGYPTERLVFVRGRVEDTLPNQATGSIALLRLDTDWYESTKHELEHLYPRLSSRGVLIIDDYGHFDGARKAVDEYVSRNALPLLLTRIDYSGRLAVKP